MNASDRYFSFSFIAKLQRGVIQFFILNENLIQLFHFKN